MTSLVLSLPEYQSAERLSVYLSMPKGELSTVSIVKNALEAGKQVFVPYTHKVAQSKPGAPSSVMDMVSLHSPEDYDTLESDAWGIPTPSKTSISGRQRCLAEMGDEQGDKQVAGKIQTLDMVIMPGLAFDRRLGRLGHGKGYYDFFLQRYKEKLAVDGNNHLMPFLSKSSPVMRTLPTVTRLTFYSFPVGLCLQEQFLPHDQEVPLDTTDWLVDAVAAGDGSLVRR